MKEKLLNFISNNKPSFDFLLLSAIMINTIFIGLYSYQYQPRGYIYILYASLPSYLLSVASIELYLLSRNKNKMFFAILWILCVTYDLVSLPLYSVLTSNGKKYLILNMSASLFLLAIMCNWWMFILSLISGLLLGIGLFFITSLYIDADLNTVVKKKYLVFYIMSYIFVFLTVFVRKREKIQEKKLDFMKVFGSAIAHEVNAPLAAMKMMSDIMDSIFNSIKIRKRGENYYLKLDSMDYEMLHNVIRPGLKQSSSDAIQITEMLLSALRDKYTNIKSSVLMSKIVQDAIDMAAHLDPGGSMISFKKQKDFEITCNEQLIKHVVYNLIKNSFKHGGENVKIEIKTGYNYVSVSDDGVGIPPDKINKIFNAFFTEGNGSGIGLAFANFVLDDINATISCESEVQKFTKFLIEFKQQ